LKIGEPKLGLATGSEIRATGAGRSLGRPFETYLCLGLYPQLKLRAIFGCSFGTGAAIERAAQGGAGDFFKVSFQNGFFWSAALWAAAMSNFLRRRNNSQAIRSVTLLRVADPRSVGVVHWSSYLGNRMS
jgi:hypothetical protein